MNGPKAEVVLSKRKGLILGQSQPRSKVWAKWPILWFLWRSCEWRGWQKQFPEMRGWEATGQTDERYLVESGQIRKFRVSAEISENDDLDRLYFG